MLKCNILTVNKNTIAITFCNKLKKRKLFNKIANFEKNSLDFSYGKKAKTP
jgi:hypothetical protein